MNNRFGIKDFVLYILIAILALVILLRVKSSDHMLKKADQLTENLSRIEAQVARMESRLEGLSSAPQALAPAAQTSSTPSTPSPAESSSSWARPNIPVNAQPAYAFANDPRKQPNMVPGGIITEIYEAQFAKLTPFISTDVYSRRIQEQVLESLAVIHPQTLEIRGLLAEAWQVDPEGLWLRARLRPSLRFSDGQPLTAEDIRWTFHEYVMDERVECERTRSILRDSIKEVKVIDPRTVEFSFHQRLFTNVDNALSLFVLPKHIYSKLEPGKINQGTGLLVGSGPFRIKDFDVDNQWTPPNVLELERNEQYWGPKPVLSGLRFKSNSDELSRLNEFKKGDGDIITPSAIQFVGQSTGADTKDDANYLKWVNMRSGYSFIAWNCGPRNGKLTPFHDKRVRMAMTHLIDRQKMIDDIYRGVGVVAKGNQPLASPGSNPDITPWPYNLAKAKALLKEAGWEDRNGDGTIEDANGNAFEFEFSFASGGEIALRIAKFVEESCKQAGIAVKLRSADWSVYQEFMKTRDFDAITLGWGASAPESDPRQIFHSESIKNQGDNFAQWANAKADELIDSGRRELDPTKRAAIWRELEAVLHEEQPYTFIRVPPWLRIVSKNVGNIRTYPKGLEHQEFFRSNSQLPTPGK